MSVFEAGMMVCFGISWPVAALKTYKCKCVHGKSIHFSMLILLGYVCGIAHKVLDNMDWVFWLYILNTFFLLGFPKSFPIRVSTLLKNRFLHI